MGLPGADGPEGAVVATDPVSKCTLRRATREDAEALLNWRNDATTREACKQTELVPMEDHMPWLERTLANPDRSLLIYAFPDGTPAGQARIDAEAGGGCELSWTIAPSARGKGIGKRMVALAASLAPRPARAEIKQENAASKALAAAAGMQKVKEEGGLEYWYTERPPEDNVKWLLENKPKHQVGKPVLRQSAEDGTSRWCTSFMETITPCPTTD